MRSLNYIISGQGAEVRHVINTESTGDATQHGYYLITRLAFHLQNLVPEEVMFNFKTDRQRERSGKNEQKEREDKNE